MYLLILFKLIHSFLFQALCTIIYMLSLFNYDGLNNFSVSKIIRINFVRIIDKLLDRLLTNLGKTVSPLVLLLYTLFYYSIAAVWTAIRWGGLHVFKIYFLDYFFRLLWIIFIFNLTVIAFYFAMLGVHWDVLVQRIVRC